MDHMQTEELIDTLEDGSAMDVEPMFYDSEEVAAFVAALAAPISR